MGESSRSQAGLGPEIKGAPKPTLLLKQGWYDYQFGLERGIWICYWKVFLKGVTWTEMSMKF